MLKTKYKKKINGYPRCHMTHKFSQSHFRIQTWSQRRTAGPRPRRLTKALQPSSQGSTGAYQPNRAPDATRG